MGSSVLGRALPLAFAAVVVQLLAVVGAAAVAGSDYDSFDAVTLNDVAATGTEVPYSGGARELVSASFDSSAFTLQTDEAASGGGLHGCLTPSGPVYAGRTGWVRFNPGTGGRIDVVAETPDYDSVLIVRAAPESAWRSTSLSQLESASACSNRTAGAGNETVSGVPVAGDRVYYVQVGGRCSGDASTCQDAATPGGASLIRLRFTPDDADGDGVADGQDNCEGQGVAGRVTADGCPDSDVDGIADSVDSCPTAVGVPAAAPYNGCPAGPRPPDPTNNPFLRIESSDTSHNAYSTSSREVELHLNWPQGATKAVIRNLKGKPKVRKVGNVIEWRLPVTKRPRVREVRVRFLGPNVPALGVGDTIIFDKEKPELEASMVLETSQGWYVGLDLQDRVGGISSLTLLDDQKNPIADQEEVLCSVEDGEEDVDCEDETDVDLALSVALDEPAYIEVVDLTGNTRVAALDNSSSRAKCPGGGTSVPRWVPPSRWVCIIPRQLCEGLRDKLQWEVPDDPELRCRSRNGAPYRVIEL